MSESTTVLWIDPVFGASGDMVLGLMADLGVPLAEVERLLRSLDLHGWGISSAPVTRAGVTATQVTVEHQPVETHRRWSSIDEQLAAAALPASVAAGARRTFRTLAEAEASVHGCAVDEVHFHEVGAVDAIIDIVGAWAAWHLLGEPSVIVGSFGVGHGTVTAAHGQLPVPAPAVTELLTGWTVQPLLVEGESLTPTGAALLTTLAEVQQPGPPAGRLVAGGRGAGGRDPASHPNVLVGLLVEQTPGHPTPSLVELVTNVDDATGEVLGHAVGRLLDAGALDAWLTPIIMKKGRPAHQLSALCRAVDAAGLSEVMMAETGTLGVRQVSTVRTVAPRSVTTVDVAGHRIDIKVGPHGAKPEYDQVVIAAEATGATFRDIAARAMAAFNQPPDAPSDADEPAAPATPPD